MTPREIINQSIHAQEQRIVELRRLEDAIRANMRDDARQIIADLRQIYSLRKIARMLERSPVAIGKIKDGSAWCSHEMYLELFDLWNKLQRKAN